MVQARSRAAAAVLASLVAVAVAWGIVAVPAAPAADAAAMLPTQTLYLSERFSQSSGPARGAVSDTFPEQLLALRGEREGFQTVVNNNSGAALDLAARIVPTDNVLAGEQARDAITFELLRVGFVNVPTASTRVEKSKVAGAYTAGAYADPLPPFRNETAAGRLSIAAGAWGGVATIAKVRTDATAGVYTGALELYDPRADVVWARQNFSLDVRAATLLQDGSAKSFKTVMGVEADAYWLQSKDMRNGLPFFPSYPDRMLQLQGLFSFLDSRGITPESQPFASPAKSGRYTCSHTDSKYLPKHGFLDQLKTRYFGQTRDIDPSAQQFPTRMFPVQTGNCDPQAVKDDYLAKIDKYRTPTTKQDDVLDPNAKTYWKNVAREWTSHGLFNGSVYAKNPFDEPSNKGHNPTETKRFKEQYVKHVPKANQLLHAALGKKAKVVLADWPRDDRSERKCRPYGKGERCTNLSGDDFSNRKLWDGKGSDEVDVWVGPFSRLFGRPVPADVRRKYKVNRDRYYAERLAKVKKLRGGREVWAYNFYTGNAQMPQLTIDAPLTDARMNYWILAREGHTGLFISNAILGWGADQKNKGGTKRKGDPYDGALYFKHPSYGTAAGWGTFLYYGYKPSLGLNTEADRNTGTARPVSSLRFEGMRDGQEDANLMQMYRDKFGTAGQAKVEAVTKAIFPGTYIELPKKLGNVTFPKYSNDATLAQRMERQRREMITALTT